MNLCLDPCRSNPCANGGTCIASRYSSASERFHCQCLSGFTGSLCERQSADTCALPKLIGRCRVSDLSVCYDLNLTLLPKGIINYFAFPIKFVILLTYHIKILLCLTLLYTGTVLETNQSNASFSGPHTKVVLQPNDADLRILRLFWVRREHEQFSPSAGILLF